MPDRISEIINRASRRHLLPAIQRVWQLVRQRALSSADPSVSEHPLGKDVLGAAGKYADSLEVQETPGGVSLVTFEGDVPGTNITYRQVGDVLEHGSHTLQVPPMASRVYSVSILKAATRSCARSLLPEMASLVLDRLRRDIEKS